MSVKEYATPSVTEYGAVERITMTAADDKCDPGSDETEDIQSLATGSIRECN
jgi:hypothetical protein